jgi:hypothetical protein
MEHVEYDVLETPMNVHMDLRLTHYTMPASPDGLRHSQQWEVLDPPLVPRGAYRQALHPGLYAAGVNAVTLRVEGDVIYIDPVIELTP